MTEWQVKRVLWLIKLVLWLLEKADSHDISHGEKHHYHKVMEFTLKAALSEVTGEQLPLFHTSTDIEANDIPF